MPIGIIIVTRRISLVLPGVPGHVGAMNEHSKQPVSAGVGRIETEILRLTEACGPAKSICPSEVARALDPEWQKLSSAVRRAAIRLAEAGQIDILRKGKRVEPAGVKGVIRLRIGQPPSLALDGAAPAAGNEPAA